MENPMTDINSAGKAYAAFVMREMNLTPSALAKGAKLASTTLTRALNDPTHQFNLSTTTINKIAKFSGISPAPFFQAKDYAEMALSPMHREDMYTRGPLGRVTMSDEPTPRNLTYVIGEAAAGVWRNPGITNSHSVQVLWLAIPDAKESEVFALEMVDDSATPYARKGEYVLFRRPYGEDDEPRHGDLVAIERWTNGLMEITIRRAIIRSGVKSYFQFDSDDPRYGETIEMTTDPKHRTYKVLGTALYSVRDVRDRSLAQERTKPIIDPFQ
jgi:hypothetical protein